MAPLIDKDVAIGWFKDIQLLLCQLHLHMHFCIFNIGLVVYITLVHSGDNLFEIYMGKPFFKDLLKVFASKNISYRIVCNKKAKKTNHQKYFHSKLTQYTQYLYNYRTNVTESAYTSIFTNSNQPMAYADSLMPSPLANLISGKVNSAIIHFQCFNYYCIIKPCKDIHRKNNLTTQLAHTVNLIDI